MDGHGSKSPTAHRRETANDLLKRRAAQWFWRSMVAAVAAHFAIFALFPKLGVTDLSALTEPPISIVPPPAIEIPPPPQEIARPIVPAPSAMDVPDDVVIPRTTWDANPPAVLPPPPTAGRGDDARYEAFSPTMVAPRILNRAEVERALQRHYPPLLRDAGIGGTVGVRIWLEETGAITRAEIAQSSGYPAMDEAALRVVDVMRLSPAQNRDRAVRVLVLLPVQFIAR